MGKKAKHGKSRLDKFYYLAKEQGFRSRAAFKLIQLNKKFHFLDNARCVIDLCAAPGGWLQVAAKEMPVSSLIVGVDLDPIKPIKNVITLQEDITTQKCRAELKKVVQTWKADVVLNDGAPNVGGAWTKDAFTQAELCLWACKLATEFLRKGGWFVTKVFRSQEYNSLLWALNQLFEKVEATKPTASRSESAEIFVVCQGFIAPKKVDPRLLDSRHVFQQIDANPVRPDVLKQKKEGRQRMGYEDGVTLLYKEATVSQFMEAEDPVRILTDYNCLKFTDKCKRFREHALTTREILQDCEDVRVLGKRELRDLLRWRVRVLEALKKEDTAAAGEAGEDAEGAKKGKKRKAGEGDDEEAEGAEGDDEEDEEAALDEELAELQREALRKAKRKKKSLAERRAKLQRRIDMKMVLPEDDLVGATSDQQLFGLKNIRTDKGLEEADIDDLDEDEYDGDVMISSDEEDGNDGDNDEDDSDDEDEYDEEVQERRRLREIEQNIDVYYDKYLKGRGSVVKRVKPGKKEKKIDFEIQNIGVSGDFPEYDAPDLTTDISVNLGNHLKKKMLSGDSDDDEDGPARVIELKPSKKQDKKNTNSLLVDIADKKVVAAAHRDAVKNWFDQGDFEGIEADSDDDVDGFISKHKRKVPEVEDEDSEEEEEEVKAKPTPAAASRKAPAAGAGGSAPVASTTANSAATKAAKATAAALASIPPVAAKKAKVENAKPTVVVPLVKPKVKQAPKISFARPEEEEEERYNEDSDEDMSDVDDSDSEEEEKENEDDDDDSSQSSYEDGVEATAQIAAMAKELLTKKRRLEEYVEDSYNRFAFNDRSMAPDWFQQDEIKANRRQMPVSREVVDEMKAKFKAVNARPIQKVAEAKARKKMKAVKAMEKMKKQANSIAEQEEVNAKAKMRALERLYAKANKSVKRQGHVYVVARKVHGGRVSSGGRTKMVDARMKKELRAKERKEKAARGKGKGKGKGRKGRR